MQKAILIAVLVVLPLGLLGGAGAAYVWLTRGHTEPHADPRAGEANEHGHDRADADHAVEPGHDEHAEGRVRLSEEAIRQFGVQVVEATGGKLEQTLKLPAEIALNADRVAHVVPRVTGMVREIHKNVGDKVEAGELMAVLESRELAEAKAADLAAEARLKLAETNFKRIEGLLAKKIAPEQEYYEARQKLEEAQIAHRETMAKLHALGLDHDEVNAVAKQDDAAFSRYEIRAPFAGHVVEKHAALGEVHGGGSDVFVVADLSNVWVDITTYPQDAARVQAGANVRVIAPAPDGEPMTAEGTITYVSPIIRESTRTGLARAVIPNDALLWKPGLFVTAEVLVGSADVPVLVSNDAIQTIENQTVVFVAEDDGFEKRPVALGRANETHTALVSGLQPGERYVAKGAFILKAELSKGTGEHEH